MATQPLVSVSTITYNHAPYIAQCIEGVLMQETSFRIEHVIGEDCSTDGTRDIVSEYARKHPSVIRVITSDANVGARQNARRTRDACRGSYVARCEGDDYWTDPRKLQKQVDFLESHPECSMCFHNVVEFHEDGSQPPRTIVPFEQKDAYTLEDLLLYWNFVPTCSTMYRGRLEGEFPDWYYTLRMGDWPRNVLSAQHGWIGHIDETMAAHRIHFGGVWSSASELYQLAAIIDAYERINVHLGFRYDRIIRTRISKYCLNLARLHADGGDLSTAKAYFRRSLSEYPFNPSIRWIDLGVMSGRLYAPALYRALKRGLEGVQA